MKSHKVNAKPLKLRLRDNQFSHLPFELSWTSYIYTYRMVCKRRLRFYNKKIFSESCLIYYKPIVSLIFGHYLISILVTWQDAARSSVTQHAMSPEFSGKWGTEVVTECLKFWTLGFYVPFTYPATCGIHRLKQFVGESVRNFIIFMKCFRHVESGGGSSSYVWLRLGECGSAIKN